MALAQIAAYTRCLTLSSGLAQGIARAQTGELNPCDELAGHLYQRPASAQRQRQTWIATDDEPRRVESWTSLTPIPQGWHLVTQTEAAAIQRSGAVSFALAPDVRPTDPPSQVAALTYAAPSPAAVRDRRLPRAPREARLPRTPREPRAARPPRLPRAPRPARPRRPARPARPPRAKRAPRPRRPKNYKTKQKPGICKGPGCHCWTPAGCTGDWYLELLPAFAATDCFKGPCYSYEACVTDKCAVHIDCLAATIFQFWAKAYHAVAANPLQVVTDVSQFTRSEASRLATLARHPLAAAGFAELPPEPGAITEGCPPGTRWAVGLTGYSCQSPATHPIAATREQLIAAGILRA